MADHHVTLSKIARDPSVAAFLARGERSIGPEPIFALPPRSPILTDGAAAELSFIDRAPDDEDAFAAMSVHFECGSFRVMARQLEDA